MLQRILRLIRSYFTLIKYKLLYGNRFVFSWSCRIGTNLSIRMDKSSSLYLGKNVIIRNGVNININNGGKVNLNDGVFINDYCCINSRDRIIIDNEAILGQGVKLYDHDHDYRSNNVRVKFKTNSLYIGKETWIGSNVIILRGSNIGHRCVIGAGTVGRLEVLEGCLIIPNREVSILNIS